MLVRQEFCRLIHKAMILIVNSGCTVAARPDLCRVQVKFSDSAPGRARASLTTKPNTWFPGLRERSGKLSFSRRVTPAIASNLKLSMRAFGLGNNGEYQCSGRNRSSCTHRRSALSASLCLCSATPGFARQAKNTIQNNSYQLQSASSSYAYEPQTVAMIARRGHGQCWIATDASRPYGYTGSCANPLAYDPSLSPTYNGELHGE